MIESVVLEAERVEEPAVEDFTEKITTPEALLTPNRGEIVSVTPRLEVSTTVFPGIGFD